MLAFSSFFTFKWLTFLEVSCQKTIEKMENWKQDFAATSCLIKMYGLALLTVISYSSFSSISSINSFSC